MVKLFLVVGLFVALLLTVTMTSGAGVSESESSSDSVEALANFDGLTAVEEEAKLRTEERQNSPPKWEDSVEQELIDRLSRKQQQLQYQQQLGQNAI